MALIKSNIFLTSFVILAVLLGVVVGGTVHKVGDSKGWTMMDVNYEAWTSSRTFQVGDSLLFQYNNNFHDVTQVSSNDFVTCQTSKPLAKYQTGSDAISLTKPGLYNFICGVPSHCEMGQKVQILVLPASLGPVAAPTPRPVRSPTSSLSPTPSPLAPSPLQSGASKTASWIIATFSLMALLLAF